MSDDFSVAVLGDSLAVGIGASLPEHTFGNRMLTHLQEKHQHVVLHNFGQPGAKVRDVILHQLPLVKKVKAQLVICIVGSNDVVHRTSADTFRIGSRDLFQELSQLAEQVVVFNIPRLTLTPAFPKRFRFLIDRKINAFNRVLEKQLLEYNNVKIFDFFSVTHKYLSISHEWISEDRYHPNDKGYRHLAELVTKMVI